MRYFQKVFIMISFLLASSISLGGQSTGNGGDSIVADFISVGDQATSWLQSHGMEDALGFNAAFLKNYFEKVKSGISSTNDPLIVDGLEKDAVNYPDRQIILLNRARWLMNDQPQRKWRIVLHELLGVSGIPDKNYEKTEVIIKEAFKTISGIHMLDVKKINSSIFTFITVENKQRIRWVYDLEKRQAYKVNYNLIGASSERELLFYDHKDQEDNILYLSNPLTKKKTVLVEGNISIIGDLTQNKQMYIRRNIDSQELLSLDLLTQKSESLTLEPINKKISSLFVMPRGEIVFVVQDNEGFELKFYEPRYKRVFRLDSIKNEKHSFPIPEIIKALDDNIFILRNISFSSHSTLTMYSLVNNDKKLLGNTYDFVIRHHPLSSLFYLFSSYYDMSARISVFDPYTGERKDLIKRASRQHWNQYTLTPDGNVVFADPSRTRASLELLSSDGNLKTVFEDKAILTSSGCRFFETGVFNYVEHFQGTTLLVGITKDRSCNENIDPYLMDLWFFDIERSTMSPIIVDRWNY